MKKNNLITISSLLILLMTGCQSNTVSTNNNNLSSSSIKITETKEITNEEELFAIKDNLNCNYILKNDITLTKTWKTIGSIDSPYAGTFDGNGYTISNMNVESSILNVDDTSIEYMVGMFGVLSGDIKNLTIDNLNINISEDTISNSNYSTLLNSSSTIEDFDLHVGLVGLNKGDISNVKIDINYEIIPNTSTTRIRIGGVAGKSNDSIENCNVNGIINIENLDGYIRAGGIAGYVSSNGIINNSHSNVNINATITSEAKMNIGGLIGNIECGIITNSSSKGTINSFNTDGKASLNGGLVGLIDNTSGKYEDMSVEINNCYSLTNITATGAKSYAAGFIGQVDFDNIVKITNNACSGITIGIKGSFGFIGRIQTTLGTILTYDDFIDGVYKNTITIKNNESTNSDVFATKVDEINL